MYIAQKLRKENIAEYLLYMWQVEDLIRACHLDIEKIKGQYLSQFTDLTEDQRHETEVWYSQLIDMMRSEKVAEHGHLQINRNIIISLRDLHNNLIASGKFPYFKAAYYGALPAIVELRKKSGTEEIDEIETCFNLLYGIMLLRMQGKEISQDTNEGIKPVSGYISMLSGYYHQNESEPIDFD